MIPLEELLSLFNGLDKLIKHKEERADTLGTDEVPDEAEAEFDEIEKLKQAQIVIQIDACMWYPNETMDCFKVKP